MPGAEAPSAATGVQEFLIRQGAGKPHSSDHQAPKAASPPGAGSTAGTRGILPRRTPPALPNVSKAGRGCGAFPGKAAVKAARRSEGHPPRVSRSPPMPGIHPLAGAIRPLPANGSPRMHKIHAVPGRSVREGPAPTGSMRRSAPRQKTSGSRSRQRKGTNEPGAAEAQRPPCAENRSFSGQSMRKKQLS